MSKVNLCVVNVNDGGNVMVDIGENEFWDMYVDGEDGEIGEGVDYESGMKELWSYFYDYGDREEKDIKKMKECVKKFNELVLGKKGKFYVWGVEYDCELMFIEE